jgi:site-specific DNA recombinase
VLENKIKGIIYCRVSSQEQVSGTSLDTQERACLEYAERNQIGVLKTFVEKGESATAADRTEFLKALEYCRKHKVQAFIVWKIDRFARNTTDHFAVSAKLKQHGAALHSVTEPIKWRSSREAHGNAPCRFCRV